MKIEHLTVMDELKALLTSCDLPVADIHTGSPILFFGMRWKGVLAAVVGLELYRPYGLLRSLAVAPAWRGRGLGQELVAYAESFAAAQGIESVFLLTTSAEKFFLKLGYSPATRDTAPSAIQATAQFAALCPASSALLTKKLVPRGAGK